MKILYINITILVFVVSGTFGTIAWKQNSADRYTLANMVYERAEPEREWKSHDYVILRSKNGDTVKYLCPDYIRESMIYGTTYDVTIIDGDFSLPSMKVESIRPAQ